jgi:uncharacterized protein (DUF2267 family)
MNWRDWLAAFAGRAGIGDRREAERSLPHIAFELGGCLTWVEAQNIADELPRPLAGAVREGAFGTAMARFSGPAFVARVAERDGLSLDESRRRVSAFLSLLREQLPGADVAHLDGELARWRPELAGPAAGAAATPPPPG